MQLEALRREIELRMKANVANGQTVSCEVNQTNLLSVLRSVILYGFTCQKIFLLKVLCVNKYDFLMFYM